jgi:pimeloyl-ACP methyl ester carboxylesterase
LLVIPALLAGGFVFWAQSTPRPMPEALQALEASAQTDGVVVTTGDWLVFRSTEGEPATGFVFYPGGRVDPRSYAPAARAIAAQGHLVVILKMPLNLAFFAPQRAASVIEAFPGVAHWAIGGHSLGGAMAARFVHEHPASAEGLVLWAAYPADNNDLAAQDLAVTSIYGTLDGLATIEKINASRPLLPADTRWVAIEGGNHAQFGWYGPQSGDNATAIGIGVQQQQVIAVTAQLLESLRGDSEWPTIWELTKASSEPDLVDGIGNITQPSLVIGGNDDRLVPVQSSVRLARELPNAEMS